MNSWRADLGVRVTGTRKLRDLVLLGGELGACVCGAFTRSLAGGEQLAGGALAECLSAHCREHLMRRAKLLARHRSAGSRGAATLGIGGKCGRDAP